MIKANRTPPILVTKRQKQKEEKDGNKKKEKDRNKMRQTGNDESIPQLMCCCQ